MQTIDSKDITIIGGGPTGLFGAFYAGMRGVSARIVDSLPELGGQLMALYPEKYIYDVGGFPAVTGSELVEKLIDQGLQFGADVHLDEEVQTLERTDDGFIVETETTRYPTKTALIAGGKGAFAPRTLGCPGYDRLLGSGVSYHVKDPQPYEGKRVLIVGGGDSAVDWALDLKDRAEHLTLIHRRDRFRAHARNVEALRAAADRNELDLLTHWETREIHGDDHVSGVTIYDNRSDDERTFDVDAVIALIGFKPNLGPIADWGLEFDRNSIRVSPTMETNIPGIYAAGDIVTYEGKLDLIAAGFSEAAIAVNHAVHRVDPDARVNPGHSTNMKVFKGREEEEESKRRDSSAVPASSR